MPYLELDVLNNAPQPILGIDLGTTYSLAALWRDGRPVVLRPKDTRDGRIPSVVHFPAEGGIVVGARARALAVEHPETTLFSVKRFMGRGLADLGEDLERVPLRVTEAANGLVSFHAGGRAWTPQELSARILRHVWEIASEALGEAAPTRAVITVPAYFDDAQRQATRDAARIAGLEAVRILNEPTAASLAYGLDQKKQGTVAVYDFGGGTFDVSILSIEDGVFRVLSTAGDTHLGGDDVDRALLARVLARPAAALAPELLADPAVQQTLRLAAERCKIELTRAPLADFVFLAPERGVRLRERVARADLDAALAPLVARTLESCARALADAQKTAAEIDEVVLVGGSTRTPAVRAAVERFFGRPPHVELDPDEVVALGAAVQGHVLSGGTRELLLLDVTPLSLGLETMGGAVSKLIQRNTPIPAQATEHFTTYADDQTGIDFNVVQGERELARDCRSLGRFQLKGIPPMPAGLPRVAVRFALDADGILTVTAREESTGKEASIEVRPMHGLTDAEVEAMLRASYENARADFDASRLANLEVELSVMERAAEAHYRSAGLDRESVADIEEALALARRARGSGDVAAVQKARDELERATLPLAAALMDSVAKGALSGKRLDEV